MPRVLLVEDEVSIADTLVYALETEHFEVIHVTTAGKALPVFEQGIDFAILDVGLPDMSGFDLCRKIRTFSAVPVLFLTARDSEIDRVLGLELGGDDYVTKPFSPREVCARVRAVLRRTSGRPTTIPEQVGCLVHDPESMQVHCCGECLPLTAHEYKLLVALMSQPGRIFTREQLLEKAWDDPGSAMDRTVDAHIKSLRAKIRSSGGEDPIKTRRGLGYTLEFES
ncbi:two-component system response regulator CreB [Verrucomicrobiaceae bacterium N1E253]|uniref:Two-component system response regulator CreB n=1 Tax=Oceaniferula marina TaxID=2748318 RepID=A0A851GNP9_9BACT|nr:two-component system response regulator CreB [Oceaniferula marina]NWK57471.1 two-component system response regulator CreB [Oceaniferula marina]